ncbi:MAG: folate-binding protein [Alphaproteobacteria bacterium]|nr:folate-binding protein [Alphaproteobacteria bacterium]
MTDNAKSYYTTLPNRGLIHVEGADRVPFLQGLITADVEKLPESGLLYGCLLTAQGKFLHDFFLHHGPDFIMIDCEGGARAQDLYKRLSLYRLRAQVKLSIEENNPVYAVSNGGQPDPRDPALPHRSFEKPDNATEQSFATWDEARIRLAVPDGSRDMALERDTLLDCNIDRLHGVSFTKGCYVGQEITARMNYRGLVKKHLYPVEWTTTAPPAPFTDIHVDGALIGQARSHCGALGLMQIRDEHIDALHNAPFRVLPTPDAN